MSDPKYPYQADYIAMDANYEEEINAKKLPLALLQDSKAITLDEALEMNKVGFYHYRILLLCGLAFMADALEVNLLSFLSTCAGAEWDLTDTQKASITGVVFAGIILGSGFWGIISDWYGRKIGFILATAIITFGGVLTGFATSYPLLLFFRGLVGFGLGGANVPFDLLAELLPSNQRGCFLIYIEFFWTIGSITVAGLAWAMLDNQGWRVLALLTVIPVGLSSLISIIYLPESPRWLLSVGRNAEAEKIVRDAAMINGIEMPEFRIKYEETEESKVDYLNIIKDPALRKITLPLWAAWAGFGFTYYGIILFVSRIYSTTNDDSTSCSFDYPSIFYNALSEIAGVTLSAMLVESIGRVNMQTIFYFFSGLTAILMGIAMPDSALVVVGIIGRIAIMVASNATWVSTPELYPTEYRTFGHAVCVAMSKFGAFSSPYVVVSQIPIFIVGIILCAVNMAASFASYQLPETAGLSLDLLDESKSIDRVADGRSHRPFDLGLLRNSEHETNNDNHTHNPAWEKDL